MLLVTSLQSRGRFVLRHGLTREAGDDLGGSVAGNIGDAFECLGLGRSDAGFGVGKLLGELALDVLTLGFDGLRKRFAGVASDRRGVGTGVGQGLLVGLDGLLGLALEALCGGEIALDAFTAALRSLRRCGEGQRARG